jgi:hypothetical protein
VQLVDEHGTDLLGGAGMNCDQAATTSAPIVWPSTSLHPAVFEGSRLRLRIGQQFQASVQITISLYYARGY